MLGTTTLGAARSSILVNSCRSQRCEKGLKHANSAVPIDIPHNVCHGTL